jgi:hypothetical protein
VQLRESLQPHRWAAFPSSWIAPSCVHSTCFYHRIRTITPSNKCSALQKVHRTRFPLRGLHLPGCIPRASITVFEQLTLGTSAAHFRKCTALDSPSSWIAPSWVHSTCFYHRIRTITPSNKCSALQKVHRTRFPLRGLHLPGCIPRASITAFEQLPLQTSAAHSRKCTALDSPLRGLHLLGCIPCVFYHRIRTNNASNKCSALKKVHRTGFSFVDCTFLGAFHVFFITAFGQITLQTSAAHSRKCTALDSASWIAPSWVRSTCFLSPHSNNYPFKQVQRTSESAPH